MQARKKLNGKQVSSLKHLGVYTDGGGLYLRARPCGSCTFGGAKIVSIENIRASADHAFVSARGACCHAA
jgi:hypothetical protein